MDESARNVLRPWLRRLAGGADRVGLTPTGLTLLGFALAVGAAVTAAVGAWWWALALWLVSRLADGLDGVLARQQGSATELGGFLDIVADFAAYGGFVVGVAVGVPDARLACVALLLAYYLNGTVFLAISSLAERRNRRVAGDERSLQFVGGLTEGTETIVVHALVALFGAVAPTWQEPTLWLFTAAVGVTVLQRVRFGVRVLAD